MRLPPPVPITTGSDSISLHKASPPQHMPPAQPNLSHSILSPPFGTANFYGASSHHHHHQKPQRQLPPSSSLSPRPLAAAPGYSPPSYAYSQQHDHDPLTLNFPDAPNTELAPLQLGAQEHSISVLPSLASLTAPPSASSPSNLARVSTRSDTSYSPPPRPRGWPSGNPYSAYYTPGHGQSADSPARMDTDSTSNGTRGPLSPDTMGGRASSVSLDDPDVKMAAEALGDLKANFVSSPRHRTSNLPSPPNNLGTPPSEAEPLLSLVMTSGSLLARPIEGTVSAYNTTKNITPGFIKTPVEYVEGVVGSGLHLSGIEGGVRWFFRGKSRQHSSSDVETGESSHKRRKVNSSGRTSASRRTPDVAPLTITKGGEVDPYGFTNADKDRRLSMSTVDTLPAYDDARSPAYTEDPVGTSGEKDNQVTPTASRPSSTTPTAWQSRLIMSTSGLSIAMSEESLRSLKYCLSWLRWANEHIARVISALKESLEQYESQGQISLPGDHVMGEEFSEESDHSRRELSARITALRSDILKTLQGVIETVSKYAGGALPDNARALVRRHLTSLPQRFRLATQESNGTSPAPSQADSSIEDGQDKEVREGAQRVLVLAKEGLDMMAQVSGVLDGTIVSAEEWCERLGRNRRNGQVNGTQAQQNSQQQQESQRQQEGQQQQEGQPQQEEPQTVPFAGVGVPDSDVNMG
ncbi:unnamed protein product [Discula destructiva]